MKKEKKQWILPQSDISLSIFVGIDGERYMNLGADNNPPPDYRIKSSTPFWRRILQKILLGFSS